MTTKQISKFEIREQGALFATIEADNATEALRKAANEYPRTRAAYNCDDSFLIEWCASDVSNRSVRSFALISVPGIGTDGCEF